MIMDYFIKQTEMNGGLHGPAPLRPKNNKW